MGRHQFVRNSIYSLSFHRSDCSIYFKNRIDSISKIQNSSLYKEYVLGSTQSSIKLKVNDESIDYILLIPFGDNIMYSELNFAWESWLKVHTNNNTEAIMNNFQLKGLNEYKDIMTSCFKEMYRILNPTGGLRLFSIIPRPRCGMRFRML